MPTILKTEGEVLDRLASKYGGDDWIFLRHVKDAAGFGNSRAADGIAMGLWPSRGLEISGFEVKVSRPDFLAEIRDPKKAEIFFSLVDRFWLVVGNAKICTVDEVPETWGLIVPHGRGLRVIKHAPTKRKSGEPIPEMDRLFVAALLRKANVSVYTEDDVAAIKEAARKDGQWTANMKNENKLIEAEGKLEAVKDFEAASGIEIRRYSGEDIGRDFAAWKTARVNFGQAERTLHDAAKSLKRHAEWLTKYADALTNDVEKMREASGKDSG